MISRSAQTFGLTLLLLNLDLRIQAAPVDEEPGVITDDELIRDIPADVNHPPTAKVEKPTHTAEGFPYQIKITISDPDSQHHRISVDWNADGVYEVVNTIDLTGSFTWFQNGNYPFTILVSDEHQNQTRVDEEALIADLPPAVAIDAAPQIPEGETAQYHVRKIDNRPDAIQSVGWDFDYNGKTFRPHKSVGQTVSYPYNDDRSYIVAARVTDNDGSTVIQTLPITVTDKTPKSVVTGTALLPEGSEASFDASSSTSSPDLIKTYEWDFDFRTTFTPSKSDHASTAIHTWQQNGSYTVAVRVTDDDGSTDVATTRVDVSDLTPTVTLSCPSSLKEFETATFKATDTSVGPDKPKRFDWDWNFRDTFTASGDTGIIKVHHFSDDGLFVVAIQLTDSDESMATATCRVSVLDNEREAVLTGPDVLTEGTIGSFSAERSSSAPDAITRYDWDWNYSGTFKVSGDAGATASHQWNGNGDYKIAVRVTDDDHAEALATKSLRITDRGPTARFTVPPVTEEGAPVIFDPGVSKSFPDKIVRYEWNWAYADPFSTDSSNATDSPVKHIFNDHGIYRVALRVIDQDGSVDLTSAPIKITDRAPIAKIHGKTRFSEGEPVSFSATPSESSPDPIVRYEWDWDFRKAFRPSTEQTERAVHHWNRDGLYQIALRVTDDDGSRDWVALPITVLDKGPKARIGGPTHAVVGEKTVHDASASESAPDKIVKIEWDTDFQKNFISRKTGSRLVSRWTTPGNHRIALRVTDEDGSTDVTVIKVNIKPR